MTASLTPQHAAALELYLVRHPRPDIPAGVCYGQLDVGIAEPLPPLTARLRTQLPCAFTLHASPLQRARLLADTLGTPRLDTRLQEIHFGQWEGLRYDDIGQETLDGWAADPLGFAAPGGESAHQLTRRVLTWWQDIQHEGGCHVVVAHGGPLRVLAGHLLGLPPDRWLALDFACGQSTRIDVHPWGTVLKWMNRE